MVDNERAPDPEAALEAALEALTSWIDGYRLAAESRFRRLDAVLETLKEQEER